MKVELSLLSMQVHSVPADHLAWALTASVCTNKAKLNKLINAVTKEAKEGIVLYEGLREGKIQEWLETFINELAIIREMYHNDTE